MKKVCHIFFFGHSVCSKKTNPTIASSGCQEKEGNIREFQKEFTKDLPKIKPFLAFYLLKT